MIRVYSTTSIEEAEALCVSLRDLGIEPLLENEYSALSAVEMPTPAVPLGISVRDEDAGRAKVLIHDLQGTEQGPARVPSEEDRLFQTQVEESRRRARKLWALAYIASSMLMISLLFAQGLWAFALFALGFWLLFALVWLALRWMRPV